MYGNKRRAYREPSATPPSARAPRQYASGAPAPHLPSRASGGGGGKICGMSVGRLCIYGLLLTAYTLLTLVVGVNFGRTTTSIMSLFSGGGGGPRKMVGAPEPARALSSTDVFKSPVQHAKVEPEREAEIKRNSEKKRGTAPAHLSQAGGNHPGAGDIPEGWVYAKDKVSKDRSWPRLEFPVPTDADLANTAFITMATGDESARHAVALVQSLRDTNTRIPTVHVMLFRGGAGSMDCNNPFLRKARNRDHIQCDSMETTANEIVSQKYLDAFTRMGATFSIEDPLPESQYTKDIPGGRQIAWGMALNKLKVFSKIEYKKILWSDSDILVLNNVDHLMLEPDFTGAFTNDCCNRNADCKMSGGWWIFHPSIERYNSILDLISKPVPGSNNEGWNFGDMQVMLYMFAKITEKSGWREWPFSRDMRQGMVPGLRILPAFQNLTDYVLEVEMTQNGRRNRGLPPEGVLSFEKEEADAEGATVWNMLDPRYDGLVGNCECVPERDLGAGYFTVHYTCLPVTPPVHKPGRYESEDEFLTHVRTRMFSCLRYFYLRWYDAFARGMESRLAEPYYTGPEIRVVDPEADRETARNRQMAFEEAVAEEKRRQSGS